MSTAAVAIILASTAMAQVCPIEDSFHCVKYIRNYDGDTITFDIANIPKVFGKEIQVRIRGVDAPELFGKLPCESDLAKKAKLFVTEKLLNAKRIDILNMDRDKYFRILADVIADGESIGETLIKLKLARPYDGSTKVLISWCD